MKTILFQGDSITDVCRSREHDRLMGSGYATMVAGEIGLQHPNEFQFYNRGISGNRVVDLYARWKIDCLNLKPDYLSILIGVNDVWHEVHSQNGVEADRFEKIYDMLLTETKAALPDCKIMLLEPYVMRHLATEENWDYFKTEVALRGKIAKELADRHQLVFVPLQAAFDDALTKAPVDYWTPDGVHPTVVGHALIAHQWMDAFHKNFDK
ncbi:MAG: SGNH/GDSL hydrolase family protein [Clostridia bacterium]